MLRQGNLEELRELMSIKMRITNGKRIVIKYVRFLLMHTRKARQVKVVADDGSFLLFFTTVLFRYFVAAIIALMSVIYCVYTQLPSSI